MSKKTRFFTLNNQDEEDFYGMNILTDGDQMGELIPSLHAWMPPEAMRERVSYHKEVMENLAKKNGKNSGRNKRKKMPPYPSIQSDQNRKAYLEANAPREQMDTTQELLEEYSEDLIDTNIKGPRRPTG